MKRPDLGAIVRAFLDVPLAALRDRSIRNLVGLQPHEDRAAIRGGLDLIEDGIVPTSRDPRVLLGAAANAFHHDAQRYRESDVETKISRRMNQVRKVGVRSAEDAANVTEADRRAGKALAGMLGSSAMTDDVRDIW